MEKNRTTVMIDGREYPVASTESVERIEEVARMVDEKIREVRHNQAILNPQVAVVFAALNLADELLRVKEVSNERQVDSPPGRSGHKRTRKA